MADRPAVRSFRRGASLSLRPARAHRDTELFRGNAVPQHAAIAQPPCRSRRQRRRPECAVRRRSPRRRGWRRPRSRHGGSCIAERCVPGRAGRSVHLFVDVHAVRTRSAAGNRNDPGIPLRSLRVKHSNRRAQVVGWDRIAAHCPPEGAACTPLGAQHRQLRGPARSRDRRRGRVSDFWHDEQSFDWASRARHGSLRGATIGIGSCTRILSCGG